MNRPVAILWDWDNTLVDGWAAIEAGLNAAFRAFSLPEWDRATVLARVRKSLPESFPPMFGAEWERARDIFYATVRSCHLDVLHPMPGAPQAIAAAGAVAPQAVVSNKQGALLRAEAAHLGWAGRFGTLVGAGDASADKPAAAPLLLALERLGVPASPRVWYIGDTVLDMQAARAAGCRAVLLGDAAHDGGVMAARPDATFRDGHALEAHLLSLAKA
jgi:phosphoglycolate phosphatase